MLNPPSNLDSSGARPRSAVIIENLEPLMVRVSEAFEPTGIDWELFAVDDGSTDGSGELLDRLSHHHPRLRVLHFSSNRGQSAALAAGFRHAR